MDLTATPPPGKAWVTVELDTADWDSGNFETEDLLDNVVNEEHGPSPEEAADKANRLLETAERELREAARGFQSYQPIGTGVTELADACGRMAEALAALREAL